MKGGVGHWETESGNVDRVDLSLDMEFQVSYW